MKPAAQTSNWRQSTAALVVAFVAMATVMVGCSKDDGGGSNNAINPFLYGANGCIGCGAGTSTLGTAIGRLSIYGQVGVEIALQFFNGQGSTYFPQGAGYISQVGYSGQIGASGVLSVFVNPATACPIPPGRYPIQTIQAGQLSGNSVYGLILRGSNLDFSLANGYIQQASPLVQSRADGQVFANSIVGRVQIRPMGGYACQSIDLSGQLQNYYEDIAF